MRKINSMMQTVKLPLYAIIASILLASSPLTSAELHHDPITIKMKDIPLKKLIEVFSLSIELDIVNSEIIPGTVTANVELNNVPADEVFANILRCGGLGYVQAGNGIELFQKMDIVQEMHCTLTGTDKVESGKLLRKE